MRLASITLPNADNNGAPLHDVHAALRADLLAEYGGYTATASVGGWIDQATGEVYEEPGTRYDVAMDATPENAERFESLAKFHGVAAGQICVFVVHASGDVAFVDSVFFRASVAA